MFLALAVLCILFVNISAQTCTPDLMSRFYLRVHKPLNANLVWDKGLSQMACEVTDKQEDPEGYHIIRTEKQWANAKFPMRNVKMRETLKEGALERRTPRAMIRGLPEGTKFGCHLTDWGLLMKIVCLYGKNQ